MKLEKGITQTLNSRFLFPTLKDRLMAEAQDSLASSPELSLVKGSDGDLEHRSKVLWAWEWENKKSAHQGLIFFTNSLQQSLVLPYFPLATEYQAAVATRQLLSRSLPEQ